MLSVWFMVVLLVEQVVVAQRMRAHHDVANLGSGGQAHRHRGQLAARVRLAVDEVAHRGQVCPVGCQGRHDGRLERLGAVAIE